MLRSGDQVLRLAHLVADVVGKARRYRSRQAVPRSVGRRSAGPRRRRGPVRKDISEQHRSVEQRYGCGHSSRKVPGRRAGLSGMVLAELRELAGQLGITGTTGMRKGDLIAAIKERQGGSGGGG